MMNINVLNESETSNSPASALTFADLGLSGTTLAGIAKAGFDTPTPIQQEIIPVVLKGRDVIAQAKTGSGKTAAFALPAIEMLEFNGTVECLVLTPTRELASQIVTQFELFGKPRNLRVATVVGGQSIIRQIDTINRGVQVIVATPGRLLDLLQSKRIKKFMPKIVVLDEADEILDMGFIDDVQKILEFTPEQRQTLLFSATMPTPILKLVNEQLDNPARVVLTSAEMKHENISQILYVVNNEERENALIRIIEHENPDKAIIFCNTKKETDDLTKMLNHKKMNACAIHGDLKQATRNEVVRSLKNGHLRLLVATDVASRGLDINGLSHVFNFHVPERKDRYTHRIGRTGRGSAQGRAITIATPMELKKSFFLKAQMKLGLAPAEVPGKQDIEMVHVEKLMQKVNAMKPVSTATSLCDSIADEALRDFTSRLLAMVMKDFSVEGPEKLGLSLNEIKSISENDRGGRYGGSSSGYSRGGSRDGGGYRGRSQGGRPSYGSSQPRRYGNSSSNSSAPKGRSR